MHKKISKELRLLAGKILPAFRFRHSFGHTEYLNDQFYMLYTIDQIDGDNFLLKKIRKFNDVLNILIEMFYNHGDLYKYLKERGWCDAPTRYYFETECDTAKKLEMIKSKKGKITKYLFAVDTFDKKDQEVFIEYSKIVDQKTLAKELIGKMHLSIAEFEDKFGSLRVGEEGGKRDIKSFRFKNWKIFFSGKVENKNEIINLLNKAEEKLQGKYKDLCYGSVEVRNSIAQNTLADYDSQNDTIRIKNRADNEMLKSFLHELGHRLWYKFLSVRQQTDVMLKFKSIKKDEVSFKKDDIVELSNDVKFQVLSEKGEQLIIKFTYVPEKEKRFQSGEILKCKMDVIPQYEIKSLNGKEPRVEKPPTEYSMSSYEEFFAECFAFGVLGKLDKNLEKWFFNVLQI